MSYNVRDDNALFGPSAGVEIPNGAAAPTVALLQIMEPASLTLQTAPTSGNKYCIFIAPPSPTAGIQPLGGKYTVVGVEASWGVASTSGTIQIEKCTTGTADGSGTSLLSPALSGSTTAATPVNGVLVTNATSLTMLPTDRLNVVFGGTTTNWVNLVIMVYISRVA